MHVGMVLRTCWDGVVCVCVTNGVYRSEDNY